MTARNRWSPRQAARGAQRAGTAGAVLFVGGRTSGPPMRCVRVPHLAGEVVGSTRTSSTSAVERVEPDVERVRPPTRTRRSESCRSRVGAGCRARPRGVWPSSRAPPALRRSEAHRRSSCTLSTRWRARLASRPARRTRPLTRPACCAARPAQALQGAEVSEKMCRVSPKRYSPVNQAGWSQPVIGADDLGELRRGVGGTPPPTLKTRPTACFVGEDGCVLGGDDILDVHIVADCPAVLVDRRAPPWSSAGRRSAGAGVGVMDRWRGPWTMLYAAPRSGSRSADPG